MIVLFVLILLNFSSCEAFRVKRTALSCEIPSVNRGYVINGSEFARGSYPWMVALMFVEDGEPPRYFCGGSLISTKHVLTGE
jgi:secreted trypsin-like serine protease